MKDRMNLLAMFFLLLIVGYFTVPTLTSVVIAKDVSTAKHVHKKRGESITVKGIVTRNFYLLGKGCYELRDRKEDESIWIQSDNLPQVGETVYVDIKKIDLAIVNDDNYSVYIQINK